MVSFETLIINKYDSFIILTVKDYHGNERSSNVGFRCSDCKKEIGLPPFLLPLENNHHTTIKISANLKKFPGADSESP